MKMALAVWEGRISPVLDASRRLAVLEVEGGRVLSRREQELEPEDPPARAARLAALGLQALVCGAVSRPLAGMIEGHGIRLIPFVSGASEEVLAAFLAGRLPCPALAMPGCCGRRGGAGRRGAAHRGGCGRGGRRRRRLCGQD